MQTISFLKDSFLSNICALLTSFLSWHFPRNSALGDIYKTNLKSTTEPMFRQPLGLWGLFGFSNVLCYNKTIQVFPAHGSKFFSLIPLHPGHSSKALYMPPFLTLMNIPRTAVKSNLDVYLSKALSCPLHSRDHVALKAVGTPFSVLLAFLLVPRKHKVVAWGVEREWEGNKRIRI